MGNPYDTEESDAMELLEIVRKYPVIGRYLSHHVRNELCHVQEGAYRGDPEIVDQAVRHIAEDLRRVGL